MVRVGAQMDVLEFYGLKEEPFRLTPDPMFFFPSSSHNEALLSMNYVIEQKEGFCMITGEPGTGKTTLLNVFKDNWKDKGEIALILTPRLSPEEFLLTVLEDLNVKILTTNKNDILKAFRDFLIDKFRIGKPVIIIVDEAQDLPDETLEELRLLSNLETYKDKLLQIILIGQPELEKRLNKETLKQLNQRITVRIRLIPLAMNETLDYINYRLIKAGKGFLKLGDGLQKPIYNFSAGIPRIINIISSRAIMSAYLEGSNTVSSTHVRYAIKHFKDLELPNHRKAFRGKRFVYALSFLCVLAVVAAAGYYFFIEQKGKTVEITKNVAKIVEQNPTPVADTAQNKGIIEAKQEPKTESIQKEIKAIASEDRNKNKKTATVIVNSANLRSKPSLDSEQITWASKGIVFEVNDEFTEITGKKWYKIQTSDGRECWIADKVVSLK